MKQCTTCNQTYTDDLLFCLADGTPLINFIENGEQQTVVRSAPMTAAKKPVSNSGSIFKLLSAALGLLLILVLIGGAAAAWIFWPKNEPTDSLSKDNSVTNAPVPVPSPARPSNMSDGRSVNGSDLTQREEELERERKKLADERTRLDDEKRRQTEPVEPERPRFTDPGIARISFSRGSTGETVSGTVGRSRSYILRTMAGQYLSGSIRSAGGCVVFSSGSSDTGFTTGNGDTRLSIQNNCDQPQTFSMSVSIR